MVMQGTVPFTAGGTADSAILSPSAGAEAIHIYVVPNQAGTAQLILRDRFGGTHTPFAAQAGIAGEANIFRMRGPFAAFSGIFVRYTNTSGVAGVANFAGSE